TRTLLFITTWCIRVPLPVATTLVFFFFFNAPPPTEIYTLSLHDALPISIAFRRRESAPARRRDQGHRHCRTAAQSARRGRQAVGDRKSTRLNSSHLGISYAVFCLKKKKNES